MKTMIWICV